MNYLTKSSAGFVYLNLKTKHLLNKASVLRKIKNKNIDINSIPFKYLTDLDVLNFIIRYDNVALNRWLGRLHSYKISKDISFKHLYIKIITNSKHSLNWRMMPSYIREDRELLLKLLNKNSKSFDTTSFVEVISFKVLNDPEITQKLVEFGIPLHKGIGRKLKKNQLLKALNNGCFSLNKYNYNNEVIFRYHDLTYDMQADLDIASCIIENYPNQTDCIPSKIRNIDTITSKIVKNKCFQHIDINLKNLTDNDLQYYFDYCPDDKVTNIKYQEILDLSKKNIKLSKAKKASLLIAAKTKHRKENNANIDIFELSLIKNNLNKMETTKLSDYKIHKDNFYKELQDIKKELEQQKLDPNEKSRHQVNRFQGFTEKASHVSGKIAKSYLALPLMLQSDFKICRELIRVYKFYGSIFNISSYELLDFDYNLVKLMIKNCPKIQKYLITQSIYTDYDHIQNTFHTMREHQYNIKKYFMRKMPQNLISSRGNRFSKLNLDPYKDKDLIEKIYKYYVPQKHRLDILIQFWNFASKHYSTEESKNLFLETLESYSIKQMQTVLKIFPQWKKNHCLIKQVYRKNFKCLNCFSQDIIFQDKFTKFIISVPPPHIESTVDLRRSKLLRNRLFIAQYLLHNPMLTGGCGKDLSILQLILRTHCFHKSISNCVFKINPEYAKFLLNKNDFYKLDTSELDKKEKIYVYNAYRSVVHKSMLKHSKFKKQLLAEVA